MSAYRIFLILPLSALLAGCAFEPPPTVPPAANAVEQPFCCYAYYDYPPYDGLYNEPALAGEALAVEHNHDHGHHGMHGPGGAHGSGSGHH
jgi:hypothetical protein